MNYFTNDDKLLDCGRKIVLLDILYSQTSENFHISIILLEYLLKSHAFGRSFWFDINLPRKPKTLSHPGQQAKLKLGEY